MPDVDHTDRVDAGALPDRRWPPTPRWVKVFAAVGLVVLVLLVLLLLVEHGGHGPRQHLGAGQLLKRAAVVGVAPPGVVA